MKLGLGARVPALGPSASRGRGYLAREDFGRPSARRGQDARAPEVVLSTSS